MLIEIAVDKALLAIVVAGADRRDDGERLITLVPSKLRRPARGVAPEAAMLCGASGISAQANAAAIHVEFADQGVLPEFFDERRFLGKREA